MPRTFETFRDDVLLCLSNGEISQYLWKNAGSVSFLIHFALGSNYKLQSEDESNLEIKEGQGIWLWNSVCLSSSHYDWSPISLWFLSSMRHMGKSHFSGPLMVCFSHRTCSGQWNMSRGAGWSMWFLELSSCSSSAEMITEVCVLKDQSMPEGQVNMWNTGAVESDQGETMVDLPAQLFNFCCVKPLTLKRCSLPQHNLAYPDQHVYVCLCVYLCIYL